MLISDSPQSANMWMQYSAQRWTRAEDINSAIERLSYKLSDLSMDSLRSTNYDINVCFDAEQVKRLMEDSDRYNAGFNLCGKYSCGIFNLEQFCEQMVKIDLKHFLYDIEEYLPKNIIEKYHLDQSDDDEEGVDTVDN